MRRRPALHPVILFLTPLSFLLSFLPPTYAFTALLLTSALLRTRPPFGASFDAALGCFVGNPDVDASTEGLSEIAGEAIELGLGSTGFGEPAACLGFRCATCADG